MEWFIFTAPVPGAVEFSFDLGRGWMIALLMLVIVVPMFVIVRHALEIRVTRRQRPPLLRVLEGDKDFERRAA